MEARSSIPGRIKRILVLNQLTVFLLVVFILLVALVSIYWAQSRAEQGSLPPLDTASTKEQYEIAKLAAEIRQIRSDTSGTLFALKVIALFVTVGGAVGGYLIGQSQTTDEKSTLKIGRMLT